MYPRGNFFSVTKGNSRRSKPTDESIGGFVGFEVFGVGYDFTSAEFDPTIRLLGVKKFLSIIMKSVLSSEYFNALDFQYFIGVIPLKASKGRLKQSTKYQILTYYSVSTKTMT